MTLNHPETVASVLVSFQGRDYRVKAASVDEACKLLHSIAPYGMSELFCSWYGIELIHRHEAPTVATDRQCPA